MIDTFHIGHVDALYSDFMKHIYFAKLSEVTRDQVVETSLYTACKHGISKKVPVRDLNISIWRMAHIE